MLFDLCEVADLSTQFALHAIDRALELDQLSVQEAGIVFVLGEFQNYITCHGKHTATCEYYEQMCKQCQKHDFKFAMSPWLHTNTQLLKKGKFIVLLGNKGTPEQAQHKIWQMINPIKLKYEQVGKLFPI